MSISMTRLGACLAFFVAFAGPAAAHSYKAGTLEITHPWARETPPAAKVGAGYFEVKNIGEAADRLLAVETAAAEKVEIHESINENGVARMRQVETVELPANAETALKPGGYHLMLINLKEALAEGMRIPATLVFQNAGRVEVELSVESMGYGGPAPAHDGQH